MPEGDPIEALPIPVSATNSAAKGIKARKGYSNKGTRTREASRRASGRTKPLPATVVSLYTMSLRLGCSDSLKRTRPMQDLRYQILDVHAQPFQTFSVEVANVQQMPASKQSNFTVSQRSGLLYHIVVSNVVSY
jgi:hypothetical protein